MFVKQLLGFQVFFVLWKRSTGLQFENRKTIQNCTQFPRTCLLLGNLTSWFPSILCVLKTFHRTWLRLTTEKRFRPVHSFPRTGLLGNFLVSKRAIVVFWKRFTGLAFDNRCGKMIQTCTQFSRNSVVCSAAFWFWKNIHYLKSF